MVSPERRRICRRSLHIPLRFRFVSSPGATTFTAETVDISSRGVCFQSRQLFELGDSIEVFLTMPSEITGRQPESVRSFARVVHVRPSIDGDGSSVGAVFLHTLPEQAPRFLVA